MLNTISISESIAGLKLQSVGVGLECLCRTEESLGQCAETVVAVLNGRCQVLVVIYIEVNLLYCIEVIHGGYCLVEAVGIGAGGSITHLQYGVGSLCT